MENLLPIGRFSRMCQLSIKSLRRYDDLGLLHPAHVDRDTGYRYYSVAQAAEAETIRLLRAVDMPLAEIREVLSASGLEERRTRLQRHQERLRERIADQQRALSLLERLIEEDEMSYTVEIKQQIEQPYVSVRKQTDMKEIGEVMGWAMSTLLNGTPAG